MFKLVAFLLGCMALPESAVGSPLSLKIYGHDVEVSSAADGQEQLIVDKKLLHKDQYISLNELASVSGVPIAIGQTSAGGNACDGSRFILSFPAKEPVRIDGPLESCSPGTVRIDANQVVIEVAATPQSEGSRWVWSFASGFGAVEKIGFAAKAEGGWSALRSRSIDHPSQILNYSDLGRLLDERIGADRSALIRISSGPGSANYRNNLFVSTSCQAHSCGDTALLVVADIATKRMFVAIKDGQRPPLISPKVSEWPTGSSAELNAFRRRWVR